MGKIKFTSRRGSMMAGDMLTISNPTNIKNLQTAKECKGTTQGAIRGYLSKRAI